MRNSLVGFIALTMVACGSSSSSSGSPVSGTVGGAAFTPADTQAISIAPKSCTFASQGVNGTVSVAGLVLGFSSTKNLCADLTSDLSGTCLLHANSAGVELFIADVGITAVGGTASIQTGTTYNVISDPTQVVVAGTSFADAFGYSSRLGVSCAPSSSTPVTASGTIKLSSISANQIAGNVDVTFSDGGALKGDFTAAVCAASLDICAVANAAIATQGQPISLCSTKPTCE